MSEHWSTALLQEWSCQAVLELELGLPVSVVASANEIVQAKGQVGFIDLFTKPLFDTTASLIPGGCRLSFVCAMCCTDCDPLSQPSTLSHTRET